MESVSEPLTRIPENSYMFLKVHYDNEFGKEPPLQGTLKARGTADARNR